MEGCKESDLNCGLESDATPIPPKVEEIDRNMESLNIKPGKQFNDFEKGDTFKKPPNFDFKKFTGFPFLNMEQKLAAGGNINSIQIGYANDLHIGNVITYKNCDFKSGKSKSKKEKKNQVPKKCKSRVPTDILQSNEKVTRDMMILVKEHHLGYKWKSLGIALDLPDGVLDSVEYENRGYDLDELVYQLLRKWEQKMGDDSTVGKLAQALEDIEAGDVAIKLLPSKTQ